MARWWHGVARRANASDAEAKAEAKGEVDAKLNTGRTQQRHEQQHQDVDQLRDGPGIVNRIANPVAISQDELLKHVPKDAPEASHFCFGELHEEGHSEGDPEHEEEGEEDAHVARHSKDGLNVWTYKAMILLAIRNATSLRRVCP
eukprot:scaffold1023_cov313-Pinguiococcus_pyrenoidosus.AAC.4